jgi:hypothetical protein
MCREIWNSEYPDIPLYRQQFNHSHFHKQKYQYYGTFCNDIRRQ